MKCARNMCSRRCEAMAEDRMEEEKSECISQNQKKSTHPLHRHTRMHPLNNNEKRNGITKRLTQTRTKYEKKKN